MIIKEDNLNTLANIAGTGITGIILDINLKNYDINKKNYEVSKLILSANNNSNIEDKLDNIIKNQEKLIILLENIYSKLQD